MLEKTMPQVVDGSRPAALQYPSNNVGLEGTDLSPSGLADPLSDRRFYLQSGHSRDVMVPLPTAASPSDKVFSADADDIPTGAINLGTLKGLQTQSGAIASTDPSDFYRFSLARLSNVNLALTGLTADADLRLFGDFNNNGAIDAGEEIQRSSFGLAADESINVADLAAGVYFVQVYQYSGDTSYTLRLSDSAISELLPTEFNLGTLNNTQILSGTVGAKNTTDSYRFSLGSNSSFNLALTGLAADADVRLIRDANNNGLIESGEELARSQQGGTFDEALNWRTLTAGNYWLQIYQYTGETAYRLNLSNTTSSNLLPAEVDLGVLSTPQTLTGAIADTNTADVYRFSLNATSSVTLNLSGLSADADIRLVRDLNNNQILDFGETLAYSIFNGSTAETISTVLQAGTYFAQVYQYSGNTNYSLTAAATPYAAPIDNAGNTLADARDIGLLSTPQTFLDYVGTGDTNDFYRFSLDTTSSVTLNLSGLSADADMQLIRDTNNNGIFDPGEVIAYPWQDGTLPETLTIGLATGTYYIRIFPYSGSTNYSLTASATAITLPSGYDLNFGYGLVDAAAAVAQAVGQNPFVAVPNLGGNNWNLDQVNAPEVWANGYTGQGAIVAVIDSGVDYTHPDLDANIWVNVDEIAGNGVDDDGNGFVDDVRGWDFVDSDNTPSDLDSHGTHVAGTIAAENNGTGATGVAYNATIMPVRVLDANGFGSWANVAAGIRYAADNGARVINLSLGGGSSSAEVTAAIQYATNLGAVVVMASGNEAATQPGFPANLANQTGIAVGAVNNNNQLASFSNDAGVIPVNYVVAPGVSVYSTTPGNTYQSFSGTSMATPHVAGVAALILSANPTLTPAQVISLLTQTARPGGITA